MQADQKKWHCLRLGLPLSAAEKLAAHCFALGACGLEEEEEGDRVCLAVYFEAAADVGAIDRQIRALGQELGLEEVAWQICREEDWEREWRRFFKPIWATERIVVHPSWRPVATTGDQIAIKIDPKMAFGTGGHESTRLCLQQLEGFAAQGRRLLDLGCGSGVLSIAAIKLGAEQVWAVDIDPLAVANAKENLQRNGVAKQARVSLGSLDKVAGETFDIILANLQSHILRPLLGQIRACLKPGGTVSFSGLLAEEGGPFCQWVGESGLEVEGVRQLGQWVAVGARRGRDA